MVPLNAVRSLFVSALLCALKQGNAYAQPTKEVPEKRELTSLSYAPVVKKATPAVVKIYVRQPSTQRQRSGTPFPERLSGDQSKASESAQKSSGSGVIVASNGIVVTNNHVVKDDFNSEIEIMLYDGRELNAKVLRRDERTDLAVLQIQNSDREFPYLTFADADLLEVGDLVLAIGDSFGVGQTVTSGIVSALARSRAGISDYEFYIQTNAAINPGNSGGALIDMQGSLVGINTAIITKSGGSEGIGFAIPANMVQLVFDAALRGGSVRRPWLGANVSKVSAEIANVNGLGRQAGVIITNVVDGGPAFLGGLRAGDIIVSVDGKEVLDQNAFRYRFTTKGISGNVRFDVLRDGKHRSHAIALMTPPESPKRDARSLAGENPLAGAVVANLSPAVADELAIPDSEGVVVTETKAYSIARRLGIQAGDIVLEVNGQKVETSNSLEQIVGKRAASWKLTLKRGGRTIPIAIGG